MSLRGAVVAFWAEGRACIPRFGGLASLGGFLWGQCQQSPGICDK